MLVELGMLFDIRSGDYHALRELAPGNVPLVSCGDTDHGYIGRYSIPPEKRHENAVTVAYNGAPLLAKYRPYSFGAKDDIGILYPHEDTSELSKVYVAATLNALRWRYSYGRKCFKNKLLNFRIDVPTRTSESGTLQIDDRQVRTLLGDRPLDRRPTRVATTKGCSHSITWKRYRLSDLVVLRHGDFHSLERLGAGICTTVSRTTNDNGVVGRFERPIGSTLYPGGTITVSTVGADAFVQTEPFIATDNVVVLRPKGMMPLPSVYLLAAMINSRKWRYGYGRQCYKNKLATMEIDIPWKEGLFDHEAAQWLVSNHPYWMFVKNNVH